MRWCPFCKQWVKPAKKFSWLAFIVLLGVFYLPYFLLLKRKECPLCGSRDLLLRDDVAAKKSLGG